MCVWMPVCVSLSLLMCIIERKICLEHKVGGCVDAWMLVCVCGFFASHPICDELRKKKSADCGIILPL